ncbi:MULTISPECIES: hypothetical protein [unclassified Acinetobacter]|uniref:hypothetical protein n=1 Tax=unclassified Acinetobacter TaxID=196816 RepID=UPI0025787E1F|nr:MULTISPECIES: hypothetical protein [unclassified Acinetobacter]MDM1764444.1 hypothetical protein [Acinetobacter sp. 226-1]MDM1767419.1 hypothetical protein [Acinetobacter sp. 226-4]
MTELSDIKELKELEDISEVNSLLNENWVLLSIRELAEKNIYVVGLRKWPRFSQHINKEN